MTKELIVSTCAAVLSLFSLGVTIFIYYAGLLRERKQATLDAYNTLQREALDKLNTYTKKQIAEISENPRSAEYKELSALLARCEHFAVGVNSRIYDAGTLRRLADVYFVGLYDKLTPLIEKKRKINMTAKHYAELEELATSMRHKYPTSLTP